ncbi:MAG: phage holin family protein [Syntrophobacteraceae bacterium]|nr:phage holin family protein [Syntrophobacteraceae bacterium]
MDPTERENPGTRSLRGLSSLGDISSDLFSNALSLVRDEIRMASAEMSQKVVDAGKSSTLLTIGGFVVYAGFIFLLLAAALGLSYVMAAGWAFLIVAVAALIVGGVLAMIGKRRLKSDILPSETIDTAKEDTQWMRNQLT